MPRLVCSLALAALLWPAGARAQGGDEVVYYHTDAIGSVRMTTDASGAVIARYDFRPFGEAWNPPPTPDPRQFAGKEWDAETGLDYSGARYYANTTGRFTTVDPIFNSEAALTDPQRWNRYAYAKNSPLKFIDPDGRDLLLNTAPYQRWLTFNGALRDAIAHWLGPASGEYPHATVSHELVELVLSPLLPRDTAEFAANANASLIGMAGQTHHIATNKSIKSGFTAAFEQIFSKAGMSLQDPANKVFLERHVGRHAERYHRHVLDTLNQATEGFRGGSMSKRCEMHSSD
jgi:RHS repeat-associated protein